VLDGTQLSIRKRDTAVRHFSGAHVWPNGIAQDMPLGMEVSLVPGHIVLDRDPAPPSQTEHSSPSMHFTACLLWVNGRFGSQPNFAEHLVTHLAWCLAVSWAGTLPIHFRRFLPHYEILLGAKFTFHSPSLALSYFGRVCVTALHLSSGHEANFAALSTGRHLYSAGRSSRWALAHILVGYFFLQIFSPCPSVQNFRFVFVF